MNAKVCDTCKSIASPELGRATVVNWIAVQTLQEMPQYRFLQLDYCSLRCAALGMLKLEAERTGKDAGPIMVSGPPNAFEQFVPEPRYIDAD